MYNAKILLADDDFDISGVIIKYLEAAGYTVDHCSDGDTAWKKFQRDTFDVCLLDIVMPKKDGIELAEDIRKRNGLVPIIFLSSERVQDEDKLNGFRAGADDYIIKPLSLRELLLKIRVFQKRTMAYSFKAGGELRQIGNLILDYKKLEIRDMDGVFLSKITPRESLLLRYLVNNSNKILKREEILLKVWGKDGFFTGRSMDVFIAKLRRKIKTEPRIILETLHNIGLRLNVPKELM
jgi:two-component system response regulator VicR